MLSEPCAVPYCPALARPGKDTCPIHAHTMLVGNSLPSWAVCSTCHRLLKPTDWIHRAHGAETATHVACTPRTRVSKRHIRHTQKPLWTTGQNGEDAMLPSLTEHPLWPLLRPLIRVETYDRDGGHEHPRHRLEFDAPLNKPEFCDQLLGLTIRCASCSREIHPIRARNGHGRHFFVAVSCELSHTFGCARSHAARDEYLRILDALQRGQDGAQ